MIRAALAKPLGLDITTETTISKILDTIINQSAGNIDAYFWFFWGGVGGEGGSPVQAPCYDGPIIGDEHFTHQGKIDDIDTI